MVFDRYIGIDPGKGGAIANIGAGDRKPSAVSMPKSVDEINEYLTYLKGISLCPIVCIEKVSLWRSDADLGKAFGIEKLTANFKELTTILMLARMPFIQVFPIQWQSYLTTKKKGESPVERKRRLKELAIKTFPANDITLVNADALLITQYLGLKCQRELDWVLHRLPKSIVKELNFNNR